MNSPSSRTTPLLALPLIAVIVACGGPAKPELSLTGPSTAAIIWGDASPVELTLTRNETAIDEVTLSIEGLPEGVTATFDPATLAGDALATTLHLEAARDASGTAGLVIVRATGPEALVAEHVFALDVGGLTVEGSVTSILGVPTAAPVAVKVGRQQVLTDAQGHFVAHEVALPYDLVLSNEEVTEVFTGLTTATPHVQGFLDLFGGSSSDSIEITGTVTPTPTAGERVTVCTSAVLLLETGCSTIVGDGSRNSFNVHLPLYGEASGTYQLVARREVLDGEGQSVGYTGYAEAAIPYAPGTTQVIDLVLASSSSEAHAFSLDRGTATVMEITGQVSYGALLNGKQTLGADVFHLPEGAQGVIFAGVQHADSTSAITRQPVTGPLEGPITFATPVPMISPAGGATLVDGIEFVTGDPAGALVSHTFQTSDRLVIAHTFEDRIGLSELATHIAGLTAADISVWITTTTAGVETADQALAHSGGYFRPLLLMLGMPTHPDAGPLRMTMGQQRSFATPVAPAVTPASLLGLPEASLLLQ